MHDSKEIPFQSNSKEFAKYEATSIMSEGSIKSDFSYYFFDDHTQVNTYYTYDTEYNSAYTSAYTLSPDEDDIWGFFHRVADWLYQPIKILEGLEPKSKSVKDAKRKKKEDNETKATIKETTVSSKGGTSTFSIPSKKVMEKKGNTEEEQTVETSKTPEDESLLTAEYEKPTITHIRAIKESRRSRNLNRIKEKRRAKRQPDPILDADVQKSRERQKRLEEDPILDADVQKSRERQKRLEEDPILDADVQKSRERQKRLEEERRNAKASNKKGSSKRGGRASSLGTSSIIASEDFTEPTYRSEDDGVTAQSEYDTWGDDIKGGLTAMLSFSWWKLLVAECTGAETGNDIKIVQTRSFIEEAKDTKVKRTLLGKTITVDEELSKKEYSAAVPRWRQGSFDLSTIMGSQEWW